MTKWTILGALALGILAAGSFYSASADDMTGAPAFKPVSSLDALMHLNQDELKGIRKASKPRPKFKDIKDAANVLAEVGNVACYYRSPDEADWWKYGQGLKDAALALAKAAEDKDADAIEPAVQRIKDSCLACHNQYKK